jgi:hypothetical protein
METLISIDAVEKIAAGHDPVARNYQITKSYHELSRVMSQRTGPCANWCSFATWASRQAGQTIRKEDLRKAFETHLESAPEIRNALEAIAREALQKNRFLTQKVMHSLIWEAINPQAAMNRASDAVARGNQKVYAEIGREFARFIATCLPDIHMDRDKIEAFCAALRPGDPPNGQRYLLQAFNHYYQSFFEPVPKARAELILLANLEIGFHEQTRLQPEIAAALEASLESPELIAKRIRKALLPGSNWLEYIAGYFRHILGRPSPLEAMLQPFVVLAHRQIRLFLSKNMMELGFPPKVRLRLGKDIKGQFPVLLQQISNPDLIALLQQIDPTPNSLQDTGAIDWADLPDRLHFIADLFRCYQESPELLGEPF